MSSSSSSSKGSSSKVLPLTTLPSPASQSSSAHSSAEIPRASSQNDGLSIPGTAGGTFNPTRACAASCRSSLWSALLVLETDIPCAGTLILREGGFALPSVVYLAAWQTTWTMFGTGFGNSLDSRLGFCRARTSGLGHVTARKGVDNQQWWWYRSKPRCGAQYHDCDNNGNSMTIFRIF